MPLALLTLFTGLAISAVAIYYSVIGLAAIFAAAVIPIIVMGSILEVSKLVAAWWLKANWHRAPFLLKSYMLVAVVVLMLITSMGIFGFLSKAHTEQAVPVGDNMATIQIIDERIAIEQEVIAQARQDIDVLNQQIERFTELGAVSRGVNARNQQREERQALTQQVIQAQERISEMRAERAPIAASLRAIEAEVGPIKYIAKLIYGDRPDSNMLEQAVVWIIIVIVFVFDPLAVLLLLASQMSFKWAREQKEQETEGNSPKETTDVIDSPPLTVTPTPVVDKDIGTCSECDTQLVYALGIGPLCSNKECDVVDDISNSKIQLSEKLPIAPVDIDYSKLAYLNNSKSFWAKPEGWVTHPPMVYTPEIVVAPVVTEPEIVIEHIELDPIDEEIIEDSNPDDTVDIIEAKRSWKEANPDDCLKHQRRLMEAGIINQLPWEVEPFLKKKSVTYMEKVGKEQIKREISGE